MRHIPPISFKGIVLTETVHYSRNPQLGYISHTSPEQDREILSAVDDYVTGRAHRNSSSHELDCNFASDIVSLGAFENGVKISVGSKRGGKTSFFLTDSTIDTGDENAVTHLRSLETIVRNAFKTFPPKQDETLQKAQIHNAFEFLRTISTQKT